MNKKGIIGAGILALALLAAGGLAHQLSSREAAPPPGEGSGSPAGGLAVYESERYGIEFAYPKTYFLTERAAPGGAMREHHIITLVEDTQENRDVLAGKSPGREGPIAITVDIYQNDLDQQSAEQWVKNSANSTYKQAVSDLREVSFGGAQGVAFESDGLYRMSNIVIQEGGFIYHFQASFIAEEDPTIRDFPAFMESVEFTRE